MTTTATCTSPSKDGTYSVRGDLKTSACLTEFTVSSGRYSTAFDKIDAPQTYLNEAFTAVGNVDACSSTCGANDKYKGFAFFDKGIENSISTLPGGIDISKKNCLCLTDKLLEPKSWCLAGDNADGMKVGVSKDITTGATACSTAAWAPQASGVITAPSEFVGVKVNTDTAEGCKKICETSGICAPSEKGGGTLFGQENCGGWNYSGNSCMCLLQGAFQGAPQPSPPQPPGPAPAPAPDDDCRSSMGEERYKKFAQDCSGAWNSNPNLKPTADNVQKICWNDKTASCGQGQKERLPCGGSDKACYISKVD